MNKRVRHWQQQGQIKRWLQPLDGVRFLRKSTHNVLGKVPVYHLLSPKRFSTFPPNGDWTICAAVLLTETYWWQTGWRWWPISGLAPLTVSVGPNMEPLWREIQLCSSPPPLLLSPSPLLWLPSPLLLSPSPLLWLPSISLAVSTCS